MAFSSAKIKKSCIIAPFMLTVLVSWRYLNDESPRSGQKIQPQTEEVQENEKVDGYFDVKRRLSDLNTSPVTPVVSDIVSADDSPLVSEKTDPDKTIVTDKFSFGGGTSVKFSQAETSLGIFTSSSSSVGSGFKIFSESGKGTTEAPFDLPCINDQGLPTTTVPINQVQTKEQNPKISSIVDSQAWAKIKETTPIPEYKPTYIGQQRAYNENVVDMKETRRVLMWLNITQFGLPDHVKDVYRPLNLRKNIGLLATKRKGEYYEKNYTKQSMGNKCSQNISLTNFGPESSDENQIFFLETSGRGHLSPRQACAVESAARFSKLPVKVIFLSKILNLEDNITCHLYINLSQSISFHTVDLAKVFANTPLEPLEAEGKFSKSNFSATHYSDGLRLALVYKYGGFYSDLDVVVLNPLNNLVNVIGQTSVNPKPLTHRHLANGEFHFVQGHAIPWQTMLLFAKLFKGKSRIEVGPMLITAVIKTVFKVKWITDIKPSANLTVLPPEVFYPFKAFQCPRLWPSAPTCFTTWQEYFQLAVMVHMYGSMTNKWYVTRDPRHEAYSLLGPHYCPLAFYGTMDF